MPTLKEILDCSVPIIKSRLEDAVAKGLRKWEPDTSSVVFLRLLDTTVDAIDVTWRNFLSEYEIAIQIGRHTIRRRGKGSGVGVERITWLIDRSVGREVETDLDDLVSDVMRKAA
jgi:hypothetical protein